ncbi:MAG: DNA mismatch repair protein MutS [Acidobacteriota bacterium]|nr:DNA mismatch repair protein MutS [Blastocatellia bacterium]MDW8413345.1 DNA mismatch repair protein MutS [Acidobacteriota bacterium]
MIDVSTPMLKQYHEIKRQHPGSILFFRLGDFYEMFYEDALIGSRELEITLTARHKDSPSPVPMCGVPYHSASTYIAKLVRKGYRVAICEQLEQPGKGVKLVRREVTRIVTPGTAVESQLLEGAESCYLAAIAQVGNLLAVSFADVSTGEFVVTEAKGELAWQKLRTEVERYSPRELLCPRSLLGEAEVLAKAVGALLTPQDDWFFELQRCSSLLVEQFRVKTLDGYGLSSRVAAIAAAGAVVAYVRETQRASAQHLTGISYYEPADYLLLDPATVRNLELVESTEGARKDTLLASLDLTCTAMGARLLRKWLLRPSLNLSEIEERLEAVNEALCLPMMRDTVRKYLERVQDLERILSRLSLGVAGPRELCSLRATAEVLPEIRRTLQVRSRLLCKLAEELDELEDLRRIIAAAIADNPPAAISDGGVIRSGYDARLDELRALRNNAQGYIASIESRERARTGIASLKVKFNNVFGYFIEVSKANLKSVPSDYERKQTLVGGERFTTAELKEYEAKVLSAEQQMLELEQHLFQQVRSEVLAQTERIQSTARAVATLDLLFTFAELAARRGYCRPQMHEGDEIIIRAGRHPVVELQPEPFIPNDLYINNTTDRLLIVTGPNMGGKSVYLRQVALIVLMAHIGCYVPAEQARISLVDRIFTRVGAADNLVRGRSTFMVEMLEVANILNTATARSLVLLDEVGRGTATFDGLSLAWSIAEYLHDNPRHSARTIFATHYHEMTELAKLLPGVKNYQMAVKEQGREIVFLRKLVKGAASKSYGIEVARLAGLPMSVIKRAREILANLEANELDIAGRPKLARHLPSQGEGWKRQPSLFESANQEVIERLRNCDISKLTSQEALQFLVSLRNELL